jgi:hypothetical protein
MHWHFSLGLVMSKPELFIIVFFSHGIFRQQTEKLPPSPSWQLGFLVRKHKETVSRNGDRDEPMEE